MNSRQDDLMIAGFCKSSDFLFHLLRLSGTDTPSCKRDHAIAAELIAASQIQRNYGYQILNGTRKPSRDKVLALCLALRLNLPDTGRALTLAQLGQLYPKKRRDSILIFSLNKRLSVLQTNELLLEMKEELLST